MTFPTPKQAAEQRREEMEHVLTDARTRIREAIGKAPNGRGEHWADAPPRGLDHEALDVLRAELAAAGWVLRTASGLRNESFLVVYPDSNGR